LLTCPAAHIGAQAYAVLIDSYGGYILESFAAHSVKKQRNAKGKVSTEYHRQSSEGYPTKVD